jgi:ribonuclease BN (tRNA processing enzyme)
VTTLSKLSLLATLYFSQGLPYGFFTQALPTFLRQKGISLEWIGLSALLTMPWALKFLWAPMVDRYGSGKFGRRRSWIIPLQLAAVANLIVLTLIDPSEHMVLMCAAVLVTNLFAATQDIATDGFAVDLLEPHERGVANGVQVAGYRVGMVVGGGAMLYVLDDIGWSWTFGAMAIMLAVATLPIVMHHEREMPAKAFESVGMDAIWQLLARPGMLRWILVLVIYKSGDYLATGMIRPMLVDLQGHRVADGRGGVRRGARGRDARRRGRAAARAQPGAVDLRHAAGDHRDALHPARARAHLVVALERDLRGRARRERDGDRDAVHHDDGPLPAGDRGDGLHRAGVDRGARQRRGGLGVGRVGGRAGLRRALHARRRVLLRRAARDRRAAPARREGAGVSGLSFVTLGVGDAFSALHYSSCLAVEADGSWLLIDCPHPIRKILREAGEACGEDLDLDRFLGACITHLHADHASGIEGFGYFVHFVLQKKATLVAHPEVTKRLWDGHLAAGMECLMDPASRHVHAKGFADYFEHVPLDESRAVRLGPFSIECRRTIHHIPTTALKIRAGGAVLGYSADTAFDPELIAWLSEADLIVHETNYGVHTPYEDLAKLPADLRARMRLIHYPDQFDISGSVIEALVQGRRYPVRARA